MSRVWREPDGLVVIDHGQRQRIEREDVLEIVGLRRVLGVERQCVLVKSSGRLVSVSSAALAVTLDPVVVEITAAVGYVVTNPMLRHLFNWYQRRQRPPYRVAAFRSEPEARAWLQTIQLMSRLSASQRVS